MNKMTEKDYPLAKEHPELVKAISGIKADEITIDKIIHDEITSEDGRISREVLLMQAEIAKSRGDEQIALNLTRAAEMTAVPDEYILQVYNAIRPGRSHKETILAMADRLEREYDAKMLADFVREAAQVLEEMGGLAR